MKKIILIVLATVLLLGANSCSDAYAEDENYVSERKAGYELSQEEINMVNILLDAALQVESIYNGLAEYDYALLQDIENPEHQWCTECKMKALKYCYNHDMWGDTVGEWDYADNLTLAINGESDFSKWWKKL